ncbi:MAG: hypothetical protein HY554_03650 [Elusimicrobia bacterium]|nr:hypothetical protein [Elusimicrobiota bacterium]
MEPDPLTEPIDRPDEGPDVLLEFDRHHEAESSLARARIAELERRVQDLLRQHPERLRGQIAELEQRIKAAQAECDRHVTQLRRSLPAGELSEEELRSQLLILEMEYSSRCRMAEHGIHLVLEELRDYLDGAAVVITNLCGRLRGALDSRRPWRSRLLQVLRMQDQRARRAESGLERAQGLLRKAHHRIQALLSQRRAVQGSGDQSRKAVADMAAQARSLSRENASLRARLEPLEAAPEKQPSGPPPDAIRADLAARLAALETRTAAAEREAQAVREERSTLQARTQEAEQAREAALTAAETFKAAARQREERRAALEQRLLEAEQARAAAVEAAQAAQAEAARREAEREAVHERLRAAEGAREEAEAARRYARAAEDSFRAEMEKGESAGAALEARAASAEEALAEARAELERIQGLARSAVERVEGQRDAALEKLEQAVAERHEAQAEAKRLGGELAAATETAAALSIRLEALVAGAARGTEAADRAAERKAAEAARRAQEELQELRERLRGAQAEAENLREGFQAAESLAAATADAASKTQAELEKAQRELEATRARLAQAETPPPAPAKPPGPASTEQRLHERLQEAMAARDTADEQARQAESGLAALLSKIAEAEERVGDADAGDRAELRERIEEAKAERDSARALADLAAAGIKRLLAIVAEHHERAIEKERECAALRQEAERARKSWEETMTRQDAARLDEIFKLRSQVSQLEASTRAKAVNPDDTLPA